MLTDHRFLANFNNYRFLLSQLIKRDIKIKYRRSVLGIFWSFLEPLLSMIVLTIIFSTLFKGFGVQNYPVYLLTGRLVFSLLQNGSMAAMRSIITNGSYLSSLYVPKYIYPLSVVISNFVTFFLSLVVLLIVMLVTNAPITIYIIFASLPIVFLLLFTIGVGLILATVTVFFRDIEHLYGVFVMLWMYATPIFYPANIVPESWRWIQTINPMYAIIECCRSSFLYGTLYDPGQLLFAAIASIVTLLFGMILFYKYQNKFVLHL